MSSDGPADKPAQRDLQLIEPHGAAVQGLRLHPAVGEESHGAADVVMGECVRGDDRDLLGQPPGGVDGGRLGEEAEELDQAAGAGQVDRGLQQARDAGALDHHVRADALGVVLDVFGPLARCHGVHRTELGGKPATHRRWLDDQHIPGAGGPGELQRQQPDRAGALHDHRVAWRDPAAPHPVEGDGGRLPPARPPRHSGPGERASPGSPGR